MKPVSEIQLHKTAKMFSFFVHFVPPLAVAPFSDSSAEAVLLFIIGVIFKSVSFIKAELGIKI